MFERANAPHVRRNTRRRESRKKMRTPAVVVALVTGGRSSDRWSEQCPARAGPGRASRAARPAPRRNRMKRMRRLWALMRAGLCALQVGGCPLTDVLGG